MKKTLKAFTLMELIIVMAILSILMVSIMQMLKPIRQTFVDSTYYASQRAVENDMVTYITESVRYSTNLGVYTGGSLTSAVSNFRTKIGADSSKTDAELYINVITIDNTNEYEINNLKCKGRLVRAKKTGSGGNYTNDACNPNDLEHARVAMGEAFYGDKSYSVAITEADDCGFKVTVSSLLPNSFINARKVKDNSVSNIAAAADKAKTGYDASYSGYLVVSTEGYVVCKNLADPINGTFDKSQLGTTTTNGSNTYIVYTLPPAY